MSVSTAGRAAGATVLAVVAAVGGAIAALFVLALRSDLAAPGMDGDL